MADDQVTGDVKMMDHFVSLEYEQVPPPQAIRFAEQMKAGHIIGHRCSACSRVYVPPKGFCPMCAVVTTDDDEVEVKDTGTVTTYTIIDPIQYYGQQERRAYCQANILLDGASSALTYVRVEEMPLDEMRPGLRVEAVWLPAGEREAVADTWGGRALGAAVKHFKPSGEPDADPATYAHSIM